jgi:outer membrane receptor protein involved in Fe transport
LDHGPRNGDGDRRGYREARVKYVTTTTGWQLRERQEPSQFSFETRLASSSDGPLQYVLGVFYLDTEQHAIANGENATRRNFSDQHTNLEGWVAAAFSQATYSITDTFRLTGGLRYTHEEKSSDSRRFVVNTVGPDPVIPDPPVGAPANILVGTRDWDKTNWRSPAPLPASTRCTQALSTGQFLIDCSGQPTLRSGEWTILASVEQSLRLSNGGSFVGELDARYESAFDGDVSYIPETRTDATTRLDVGLSYLDPDDRFTVKAYVSNVTDETTIASTTLSNAYAVTGIVAAPLQPPRTYGVRATVNF